MLLPYKDDNPTRTAPVVTVAIIAANVVIFLYFRIFKGLGGEGFNAAIYHFGLIPGEFFSRHLIVGWHGVPTPLKLITSMFMHGGFLHLGGNMLYLWIFGNNVEDHFGHGKFFIFYMLSGLGAAFAFLITQPFSDVPMVGASGAIAGVLGAYFVLYPRARVYVFLFIIIFFTTFTLPAVFILGMWILLQILQGISALGTSTSGGIAYFAHIGGFFIGIALLKIIPKNKSFASAKVRYLH